MSNFCSVYADKAHSQPPISTSCIHCERIEPSTRPVSEDNTHCHYDKFANKNRGALNILGEKVLYNMNGSI